MNKPKSSTETEIQDAPADLHPGLVKVEWIEPGYVMIGRDKKLEGTTDYLSKEDADQYCGLGWAKNCKTGFSGKRVEGTHKLVVQNLVQKVSSKAE